MPRNITWRGRHILHTMDYRKREEIYLEEMHDLEPFLFHRIVIFILKPSKICTDLDSYRGLSMLVYGEYDDLST